MKRLQSIHWVNELERPANRYRVWEDEDILNVRAATYQDNLYVLFSYDPMDITSHFSSARVVL